MNRDVTDEGCFVSWKGWVVMLTFEPVELYAKYYGDSVVLTRS